jgi:hypothetical protein
MFSTFRNTALLAVALGAFVAISPPAQAFVVYTVDNPVANFTLFTYDAPSFITTSTTVPASGLAFANPLNPITSVDFIPSNATGLSEVDVFQSVGGTQVRFYPAGTFTQYGVTPGLTGSFGFPNSQLIVAAPEPSTVGLLGAGLFGLLALRRRSASS